MKSKLVIGTCLVFAMACKQKVAVFSAGDGDLSISAMKQNDDRNAYSIRLFPSKALADRLSADTKSDLMYRMDSCFYLLRDGKKHFPGWVETIPGGAAGGFEYLAGFDIPQQEKIQKDTLVYHDRYLNEKNYVIVLKN